MAPTTETPPASPFLETSSVKPVDFSYRHKTSQNEFAERDRMEKLIDRMPALSLANIDTLFDQPENFVDQEKKSKLHYLHISFAHHYSKKIFAHTPITPLDGSWLVADTRFSLSFFAEFHKPQRVPYLDWFGNIKAVPTVLALCGFDYRQAQEGEIFYHIRQFQAARWSKGDAMTEEEKTQYEQDLPLRWTQLATHILEQLALMDSRLKSNVGGVFIDSKNYLSNEREAEDRKSTKASRVIKKRNYHRYTHHPVKGIQIYGKSTEEIVPDEKFQAFLRQQGETHIFSEKIRAWVNKIKNVFEGL